MSFSLVTPLLSLSAVPTVTLNNGIAMPMISLGTWQYSPSVAQSTVTLGLKVGFNHSASKAALSLLPGTLLLYGMLPLCPW